MTGTEAQARKDAMADAETLLSVSREIYGTTWAYDQPVAWAAYRGAVAAMWMEDTRRGGRTLDGVTHAARQAQEAAHAAFRAVPALRGESK